jgi:lipopolysaccharide assembly outer membrane protein LptD (OstA)
MLNFLKHKHIIRTYFILTFFFSFSSFFLQAQNEDIRITEELQDSVVLSSENSITASKNPSDSVQLTSPRKSKESIDSEITYSASDSIVFYANGIAYLYGNAKVNYQEMELTSDNIRINMDSSSVQARGRVDSTGTLVDLPVFKDGTEEYETKAIDYNFNTKKGFIRGVVTQQGDGYITSDKAKKMDDNVFFMVDGKYTTCDNHDHPHFYINMTKAKVQPKQFVVAGPAYLVIADVPLPLVLPFGYFPFTDKYSSGILMPSYGEESTRGFYLRDGGYYFAMSDYFDLALRGDIYTKGSWGINVNSRYRKRYKYNGNFYASYQVTVLGEENLPDYSRSNDIKVTWTHTQDPKANPFSTFSASVNFASVSYNKNNLNSYFNPDVYGENNKSSSINYTYRFPERPFTLSGNITVNQRQRDSTISLTLPTLRFDMSRVYPFRRAEKIGKDRWYEKIHLSYNTEFNNNITTKQDRLLGSSLAKDWNNGVRHQLNMGASYNLLKYITVSPGMNYSEKWYFKRVEQHWENDAIARDTLNSFYRINNFNAKIDLSTQLYGFYKPIPAIFGRKVEMIRHVFQPTIGFSWAPDFGRFEPAMGKTRSQWEYFDNYYRPVTNSDDSVAVAYSYFDGSIYGPPGRGSRGNVNFSISNNLEMKITSSKDSTGFRKISLIDNFSASMSYNIFADSLKWSDLATSIRFKLPQNLSLTISANFTPYTYQLDKFQNPVRVDITELEKNGRLARLTTARTSFGYTFSNDTFKRKKKETAEKNETSTTKTQSEYDDEGYMIFSMPWSFRFDYSINYSDYTFNKETLEFDKRWNQTLNFSGNISFTKNWRFNFSSGYDFQAKDISYTSCGISRDLHCWTASLNLVPFGTNKTYNFLISVKSTLLQDLKYEQRSNPADNPNWY